jgi:hypothetical protein
MDQKRHKLFSKTYGLPLGFKTAICLENFALFQAKSVERAQKTARNVADPTILCVAECHQFLRFLDKNNRGTIVSV